MNRSLVHHLDLANFIIHYRMTLDEFVNTHFKKRTPTVVTSPNGKLFFKNESTRRTPSKGIIKSELDGDILHGRGHRFYNRSGYAQKLEKGKKLRKSSNRIFASDRLKKSVLRSLSERCCRPPKCNSVNNKGGKTYQRAKKSFYECATNLQNWSKIPYRGLAKPRGRKLNNKI
jgi:hypothetical protein